MLSLTSGKTQAAKRHYVMQSRLLMRKSANILALTMNINSFPPLASRHDLERPQIRALQRDEGPDRFPYMARSTNLSVFLPSIEAVVGHRASLALVIISVSIKVQYMGLPRVLRPSWLVGDFRL